MANRSHRSLNDMLPVEPVAAQPDPIKPDIDPDGVQAYNYKQVSNRLPSRVIRVGNVTGTRYEWQPGQTIPVRAEDADEMNKLVIGGRPCSGCDGGKDANRIFDVLED
jgi:hypothetical protein